MALSIGYTKQSNEKQKENEIEKEIYNNIK